MAASLRVVVWSTGGVGKQAIRAVLRRPDLELVGVWVHSPAKVGKDVGALVGTGPLGLLATNDATALLDLQPDCVIYAAYGPELDAAANRDYVRILERGINVVTVSSPGLVHPPAYAPASRAVLAAAATSGRASLYCSGMEPGFAGDHLVLTLLTLSQTVRSVRTQEIFDYSSYAAPYVMREVFGFGLPMDDQPLLARPGVQQVTWGPPIRMVAAALGAELDEVRETYERIPTPRRLEVAAGIIEPGTGGAVRFQTIGVVAGREAIVIEHVNRMAADLAPEWASAPRDGTYRITVDGAPAVSLEMVLGMSDHTTTEDGILATAMRIVNAVPATCAAPAGLVSSLDLPLTLPRFAL